MILLIFNIEIKHMLNEYFTYFCIICLIYNEFSRLRTRVIYIATRNIFGQTLLQGFCNVFPKQAKRNFPAMYFHKINVVICKNRFVAAMARIVSMYNWFDGVRRAIGCILIRKILPYHSQQNIHMYIHRLRYRTLYPQLSQNVTSPELLIKLIVHVPKGTMLW